MANPIQQGLKLALGGTLHPAQFAAMANPIQQGLKLVFSGGVSGVSGVPQWLIQYNKD